MPTYDEDGALLISLAGVVLDHQHSASGDGGPLAVGVTDTDLTAGSVWFAGVGGLLQQDNANLFWDDGNNRLGVGTVPDVLFHIASNDPKLRIEDLDGTTADNTTGFIEIGKGGGGWTRYAFMGYASGANDNLLINNSSSGGHIVLDTNGGNIGIDKSVPDIRLHAVDDSASTGVIIPIARLESQVSGGAGAAGHGPSLELYGESSTTENQSMAELVARWSVATHASRRARIELYAAYIGTDVLCGVIEAPATASADGNSRGVGAVDLQGYRAAAAEVASGDYSVISGGRENTASQSKATVGGGEDNTASGISSTIPGGDNNTASGSNSFAAGNSAAATDSGSFVWSSAAATLSWGANTFTARCHGGARFYSAAGVGTGVQLSAGGNAWAAISTRAAKRDFRPVENVLNKIAALPIYDYALKSQSPDVRHIGPVAEEFNTLFGFTEAEQYINSMDVSGVALAAIKALIERIGELERRIQ